MNFQTIALADLSEEFDQYRKEKVRERLTDVFKELDEVNKALVNK